MLESNREGLKSIRKVRKLSERLIIYSNLGILAFWHYRTSWAYISTHQEHLLGKDDFRLCGLDFGNFPGRSYC